MFSHDGSIAPLREYLEAFPRRGLLVVDDAHSAGTLGKTGKGTPELCGVRDSRLVQTISLSKAFGVYGGAILGSSRIIDEVLERSRILRGNTPLPLPLANAALKSIQWLRADRSLRHRLRANTARVKAALRAAGFPLDDNESPIVSVTPVSRSMTTRIERELLRAKIFPAFIHYAKGPGYFRFAISSEHTGSQLNALADALIRSAR
jgi:7-keto-8-aminopelargonate synthetase-like enzyme